MSCSNNFSLPDMIARKCDPDPIKKERLVLIVGHMCPEITIAHHISSLGLGDDIEIIRVPADDVRLNPEFFPIKQSERYAEPLNFEMIKRPPEPIFTENKNYLTGRTLPRRKKGKR